MARTTILLLLSAALLLATTTTAQSPAPSPMMLLGPEAAPGPDFSSPPFAPPFAPSPGGPDCFAALLTASDCLTFVSPDSNLTVPDAGCCSEISNLIDTQPICLCTLVGNPESIGLTVDTKRALRLPSICNVTTPPLSLCSVIGVPIPGVPTASPAPTAGGDGSIAASPSPGSSDNASPAARLASKQHLLVGLAAILFAHLF